MAQFWKKVLSSANSFIDAEAAVDGDGSDYEESVDKYNDYELNIFIVTDDTKC